MHKILFILGGSIVLLLLFLGLIRVKNIEEGYEGGRASEMGRASETGHAKMQNHMEHDHGKHPEYYGNGSGYYTGGGYYNGFYPIYAQYEYPIYYVNDQDDYVFDENGILYYIYNPHLLWRKLWW